MAKKIKLKDIVWFQAYKDNMPIQGKVTKIGTQVELGCGWDETDTRVFYELTSINHSSHNFVFTRTTRQWISKTKQTMVQPKMSESAEWWDNRRKALEQAAMNNQSSLDSGEHQSY